MKFNWTKNPFDLAGVIIARSLVVFADVIVIVVVNVDYVVVSVIVAAVLTVGVYTVVVVLSHIIAVIEDEVGRLRSLVDIHMLVHCWDLLNKLLNKLMKLSQCTRCVNTDAYAIQQPQLELLSQLTGLYRYTHCLYHFPVHHFKEMKGWNTLDKGQLMTSRFHYTAVMTNYEVTVGSYAIIPQVLIQV